LWWLPIAGVSIFQMTWMRRPLLTIVCAPPARASAVAVSWGKTGGLEGGGRDRIADRAVVGAVVEGHTEVGGVAAGVV